MVSFDPSSWGGEPTLIGIIGMAMFGLITVQVWITYIPSLIFTPIIMNKISKKEGFYTIPIWKFLIISLLGGIVAGISILLPCILLASTDSLNLVLNWTFAGAVAGVFTYPIIAFIYRFSKPDGSNLLTT